MMILIEIDDKHYFGLLCDSPSPSYTPGNNARRFDSFDLDSTDEIGIMNNRAGALKNLATDISSNKFSSLATADKTNSSADGNSTMNGLFACAYITNQSILFLTNFFFLIQCD